MSPAPCGITRVPAKPHGRVSAGAVCWLSLGSWLLALAACAVPPALSVPPAPPALPSLAGLVQRSAPAVVGIAGEVGAHPAERAAMGMGMGVVGSGFRIANTRLIATAAHVVVALPSPPVVVWNAQHWPARVLRIDEQADLALLEIDGAPPMPGLDLAPIAGVSGAATSATMPGQWVLVLGCPFGALPTATVGIVSALPGAVLWPEVLRHRMQLNAAINPGNSGGPVLNLDGQVIAVANATVPSGYGLGFAVPVADLHTLLKAIGGDRR